MVTKLAIGHSSTTNLAEISLIETCVRKRFEIETEIKLLSCRQDSHFTIDLYKGTSRCHGNQTSDLTYLIYELGRDIVD